MKGEMVMSKIDEYMNNRRTHDKEFASGLDQVGFNLDAAVAVSNLRESLHMTQREFAKYIGKPQSTISRIEHGNMNVSTQLLNQIAQAAHKKLKIEFV
jgi:DNA-binding XRE family transcriptional regulator